MNSISFLIALISFFAFSEETLAQLPLKTRTIPLQTNWKVQSSAKTTGSGEVLSTPGFSESGWYTTSVPSTAMAVLMSNQVYPTDLLYGDKLKQVDKTQFNVSWWYKTSFQIQKPAAGQTVFLHFDGLNYRANIWLNGKLLASKDSIFGVYRRFEFDVTSLLHSGENFLAVEVFKQKPGDPALGYVDWNPIPPDQNMGIWRPVYLTVSGKVRMTKTHVQSDVNLKTLKEAWLSVTTTFQNFSSEPVSGKLTGKIENSPFSFPISLLPNETKKITLTSEQIKILHIQNPRLWWCNDLGTPDLYELGLKFESDGQVQDADTIKFGIRKIETYVNADGHKGFKLNGKPVLIRGGGWVDDIFLRDTPESNETQVQYVKDMHLNTIRLEGVWGTSENLYDLCDRYGILLMVGWSCQWEWESYLGKASTDEFGGITSPDDVKLVSRYFEDQVTWLRNHPSIFVWMAGSDKIPVPELEQNYIRFLKKNDDRPLLISAGGGVSKLSGPSGMKMRGAYNFVGPNYWYLDTEHGGAFGFNTETGPGVQMPVSQSVKKMIPEANRWPVDSLWTYHCNPSEVFNNLSLFTSALNGRFGESQSFDEFVKRSQFLTWETMKPMFESFRVNQPKTTGLIQWMLNSAWPSFYWQLYDYDLIPTAAYYSAKQANQPLQLVYNYNDNGIYLVNNSAGNSGKLTAVIRGFDLNSKLILNKELTGSCESGSSLKLAVLDSVSRNEFLFLELKDKTGKIVTENQYCLSAKQDDHDFAASSWYHTPIKSYADFTGLNSLFPATVSVKTEFLPGKETESFKISLTNTGKTVAFFAACQLTDLSGNIIKPVFWSDNYISIPPGETRILTCSFKSGLVDQKKVKVVVEGWNY